jgi:hypothetical protein
LLRAAVTLSAPSLVSGLIAIWCFLSKDDHNVSPSKKVGKSFSRFISSTLRRC